MSVFQTLLVILDVYKLGITCSILYIACAASTAGVETRPLGPRTRAGFGGRDIAKAPTSRDML